LAASASPKARSPGSTTRPDVKQMLALQTTAGNAAVARALGRRRTVQRMPATFATTPAVNLKAGLDFNLKSGWGLFGYGSWDAILDAIRAYASLADNAYEARKAALAGMPALIASWEADHQVGTATPDADEKAKVAALGALRTLIAAEHRELAALGAGVDEKRQAMQAFRFKGDYILEQVLEGRVTLVRGDHGLYVTKVQQALADTSHLASDKVTGTFEDDTTAAVKGFQKQAGLPERGDVDAATIVKLATIFQRHGAEKALAQAPAIGEKGGPGEFAWGSAPAELTVGARNLSAEDEKAAQEAVKTSQAAGPGGVVPTFVSNLPGKGTYEARLKALVLLLAKEEYNSMAKGRAAKRNPSDLLDWDHIKKVAARSKQATDAVFGKFAVGPPLQPGAGIHDAWDKKVNSLKTESQLESAANWRVEKLLKGDSNVAALDRQHGAIQSRDPEKKIVEKVKAEIVAAKRDELVETHKAWPAFASGGEVNIQRFKATTDKGNRDVMWDLFQTVVHEYLHTLEHSRYKTYQSNLGQQAGAFTLREGVVEYFTHTVLESVTYDDALRLVVEGEFHDASIKHTIPKYGGYGERANAEKLAGVVGARNVMAAFFLGDIEKIGGKP
jgi:Putative peptidoglycan binding domain